jgi:low affinity Fe/Cu permease
MYMTAIEHTELKGITVKTLWTIIIGTAITVSTVMGTYFKQNNDINDVKSHQETTDRVNEIRLKLLENQVSLMQIQINEFKNDK